MDGLQTDETGKLLELAEKTARAAGEALREGGSRRVALNSATDVKLAADADSETLVRERLAASGLPVFGEEFGGDASLYDSAGTLYWVVDPLDGTFNFQRGQPLTCVSIGLMRGSAPVLGAIYNFNADEMFPARSAPAFFSTGKKSFPRGHPSFRRRV